MARRTRPSGSAKHTEAIVPGANAVGLVRVVDCVGILVITRTVLNTLNKWVVYGCTRKLWLGPFAQYKLVPPQLLSTSKPKPLVLIAVRFTSMAVASPELT